MKGPSRDARKAQVWRAEPVLKYGSARPWQFWVPVPSGHEWGEAPSQQVALRRVHALIVWHWTDQ